MPDTKYSIVRTGPDSISYMRNYLNIGTLFHNKDLKNTEDDHLSAKYDANPLYTAYWMLTFITGITAITCNVTVNLTFYIKFYDRK